MIINTGCRTDIPAYFSEWLFNRIEEGFVNVRNPHYQNQVIRYKLSPDVVDCLAFCTKNPGPMLPRINELAAFSQFWFVTITPYGKEIEPNVPDKDKIIEDFKKLSASMGSEKTAWRYDPIFITDKYSLNRHVIEFEEMAKKLEGYTHECVISFIDLYEKTKKNFPGVRAVAKEERCNIAKEFLRIGKKYNIKIKTCAEGQELLKYGVDCSGCLTKEVLEQAIGSRLKVRKRKSSRAACDCLIGNDIGAYNTCNHGCVYCYANHDHKTVMDNMEKHDPNSPFLIGGEIDGDVIKDARQESYIDGQMTLF
jgi:DNA repair photolyase